MSVLSYKILVLQTTSYSVGNLPFVTPACSPLTCFMDDQELAILIQKTVEELDGCCIVIHIEKHLCKEEAQLQDG